MHNNYYLKLLVRPSAEILPLAHLPKLSSNDLIDYFSHLFYYL